MSDLRVDVDIETVLDGVDEVGVFQVPHRAFQLGHILGNSYFFQRQSVQVFQEVRLVPGLLLQMRGKQPEGWAVGQAAFMGVTAGKGEW
jgi:hypothetical protein